MYPTFDTLPDNTPRSRQNQSERGRKLSNKIAATTTTDIETYPETNNIESEIPKYPEYPSLTRTT